MPHLAGLEIDGPPPGRPRPEPAQTAGDKETERQGRVEEQLDDLRTATADARTQAQRAATLEKPFATVFTADNADRSAVHINGKGAHADRREPLSRNALVYPSQHHASRRPRPR